MKSHSSDQNGYVVIATVVIIIAIVPIFIYVTSAFSTRLASTRATSTQKIFVEEAVHNIAIIVRTAYNRAKNEGCASGLVVSTPGQNGTELVNLCLPTDAEIPNRFNPDNPFVINSANALLTGDTLVSQNLSPFFKNVVRLIKLFEFQILPRAHAQITSVFSQPPLGVVTPVARPAVLAPTRQCNGVDLVCLTVRLCPITSPCNNIAAHFQKFGFPP